MRLFSIFVVAGIGLFLSGSVGLHPARVPLSRGGCNSDSDCGPAVNGWVCGLFAPGENGEGRCESGNGPIIPYDPNNPPGYPNNPDPGNDGPSIPSGYSVYDPAKADQYKAIYDGAAAPALTALDANSLWSGDMASSYGDVTTDGTLHYLAFFNSVYSNGESAIFGVPVDVNDNYPDAESGLQVARQNAYYGGLSALSSSSEFGALVTSFGNPSGIRLAFLIRQAKQADGTPAFVAKEICYQTQGCNGYQYGTAIAYKYFTKETKAAPTLDIGTLAEVTVESDLYSGTTVVGHLSKGTKVKVLAIQGTWVSLQGLDGSTIKGWIQIGSLKISS